MRFAHAGLLFFGDRNTALGLVLALVVASVLVVPAQAGSSSGAAGGPTFACNLNQIVGTPGSRRVPSGRSPTYVNVMPTRYWDLENAAAGFQTTGVPLVALDGNAVGPAGGPDDLGSYYLIPRLSSLLQLSIRRTVDVFYLGVLSLAFLAGSWGSVMLFKCWSARAVALVGLSLLVILAYRIGDVYTFYFMSAVVAVPWTLVLARRTKQDFWLPAFLVIVGALISTADWVRSYSGTAALLFVCVVLVSYLAASRPYKVLLLVCLGLGLLLPQVFYGRSLARRDAFLAAYCPGYKTLGVRHPFWHSMYIGLGYLQNDYGIRWDDRVAYEKVRSIAPGIVFGSPEYEHILKQEVLGFVREHPQFVLLTLVSKAGVILLVVLFSANFGLIAAAKLPKPWPIEVAFWAAMVFDSMFGLLIYPLPQYLLGLISFSALYGIVSLGVAIESFVTPRRMSGQVPRTQKPRATVLVARV